MKKTLLSTLILFMLLSLSSQAQISFSSEDGLGSMLGYAQGVRSDAELVAIATISESIPGLSIPSNISIIMGTNYFWLYVYRSKSPNDTIFAFGAIKVGVAGSSTILGYPVNPNLFLQSFANNPYTNLTSAPSQGYFHSSSLYSYLIANPDFYVYFNADQTKSPFSLVLFQSDSAQTGYFEKNTPYWLVSYGSSAIIDFSCLVNALNGETKCKSNVNKVDSYTKNNSFIYPNPCNNIINIVLHDDVSYNRELTIFNTNGALVKKVAFSSDLTNYSIADLARGSYIAVLEINKQSRIIPLIVE